MSDFLNSLVEVKNGTKRVSDSLERRKRILDAKRRMAARKEEKEDASSINRISDSARPTMRGTAERAFAVQGLTRKQDSTSKSYFRLRKRIKDELAETETTEEAIQAAAEVLAEEVENNPQAAISAAEDVLSAVLETVSDLLPEDAGDEAEGGDENFNEELPAEAEGEDDDEVADSVKRRSLVRRKGVADARRRAMTSPRVKDAMARRRMAARRSAAVADAMAQRRAIAASRRVRDARARRAADSQVNRSIIRRRG